jgi:hypothetical protein
MHKEQYYQNEKIENDAYRQSNFTTSPKFGDAQL